MLLTANHIDKRFPGASGPVLEDVSLSLGVGETLALTGESGSGKSTLLHIIAGLESCDNGAVTIAGQSLTGMDDAARAYLRLSKIGMIFQQFNLVPSLTVEQNLTFQARLSGQTIAPGALTAMAEALGLADHIGKYPEELSGGQQQRVAIGRALLPKPQLVLADEPTGNLDETTTDAVFDLLLTETTRAEAGLLIVTHSQRLADRTDRRLHLSHGRLAA